MDNALIKTEGIGYTLRMRKVADISEIFYYKNVLVLHEAVYEKYFNRKYERRKSFYSGTKQRKIGS